MTVQDTVFIAIIFISSLVFIYKISKLRYKYDITTSENGVLDKLQNNRYEYETVTKEIKSPIKR